MSIPTEYYRIIDVNLNRTTEGLRVCEDIFRFVICEKSICEKIKSIRHHVKLLFTQSNKLFDKIIESRDSCNDLGRKNFQDSTTRADFCEIFDANINRVKESLRVLEEFSKTDFNTLTNSLKELRYKVYDIEKESYIFLRKEKL